MVSKQNGNRVRFAPFLLLVAVMMFVGCASEKKENRDFTSVSVAGNLDNE